ncbi:hypothetical protein [Prescottella equi]|uniref:hypothetical protein n=1 Tax=Rhodococcus hoagii TaxID=43767 RepID=UPI00111C8719|nr:hypothetical protein [Prescottella equi]
MSSYSTNPQPVSSGLNAPVPAIGTEPDLEILLLGSMLFAAPADARRAVSLVELDDYNKPDRRTVHSAIAGLLSAGRLHDGTAVDDEIRRQGLYTDPVRRTLLDAITCGPASNRVAPWSYATALVARSYRTRYEQLGKTLVEAADTFPEGDLLPLLRKAGVDAVRHARRLAELRGEEAA